MANDTDASIAFPAVFPCGIEIISRTISAAESGSHIGGRPGVKLFTRIESTAQ
jgi:hypothetical protein